MTQKNPIVLLVFSLLLLSSAVFQTNYFQQIVSTKAQTSVSMIKVSLAGNFSDTNRASYKTKVTLYTKNGKAKELIDQPLNHDQQNVFTLALDLNSLDLGQFYAINIKPDKFLGKIFCGPDSASNGCTTPQIIFKPGDSLDLSRESLLAGDIKPQDGKIDPYDISSIISDIGKISSENNLPTDINSDGIVNALDYSLASSSLSKTSTDDIISFPSDMIVPTPTVSITPTLVLSPTLSILPSIYLSPTTPKVQNPSPSPTFKPTNTPTKIPSPTPLPTSKPSPTAAIVQSGICNGTLTGTVNVGAGILGSFCRKVNNEQHRICVISQSECNPNKCIEMAKGLVRKMLLTCTNGIASFDEQKSQVNCRTEFIPGDCAPEPTPACVDDRPKC